jgi:hypothetical protein
MPPGFDDNKRILQFALTVQAQNALELNVDGLLGGRQDAEVNDSRSAASDEHQPAEIAVASCQDSVLLLGDAEQLCVLCLGQTQLSGPNDVVSQAGEKADRNGIDILVG